MVRRYFYAGVTRDLLLYGFSGSYKCNKCKKEII